MTICEFFNTYRDNGIPGRNIEIIYNDELNIDDIIQYQNIIFTESPQDPVKRADIIMDIFSRTQQGVSVYMDEFPDDFLKLLEQKFKENTTLTEKNHGSLAVQHIINVGYIISHAQGYPLFITNNYTLEEYDKLSKEYVVLGIAKQEKHYINDWVAYHLHIGFDKVYLFDNNDDPNETYDEILSEYINEGKVCLVNFRDKSGLQNAMYNEFYYTVPFKWLAVIDIDEFIWFNETYKCNNIKEFLQDKCTDSDRFGVLLQWHCYATSGDDKPSDKPIWEANNKLLPFNTRKNCRCEYIHNWCKSIYKPGYRLQMNEHFAWEVDSQLDSPNYEVRENDYNNNPITKESLLYISEEDFMSQGVYVKHFLLRNISDFYFHKYLRGHAGGDAQPGSDGWAFWFWNQNLNYFTDTLPSLTEKEQIFLEKHGMKMNYSFHPDVFLNWFMLDGNDYINSVIAKICLNILNASNCFLTETHICGIDKNELEHDESITPEPQYDFSFLVHHAYNYNYFNIAMGGDPHVVRKNIQDPIVINIGVPLEYAVTKVSVEEQKQYAATLSVLFSEENIKQYLRYALDLNLTVIPKIGVIENPENCMGYKKEVTEFLQNNNLGVPGMALTNNTMIMPFEQYKKLCDFQNKFTQYWGWCSNKYICDNARGNYNTPYHAYMCSVMSVIDNPYFVWLQ